MTRILSIEDDPEFQHYISVGLQREGWEVHYAFTGREGYEKALALLPDLIMLDMVLPVYNGPEVARRLAENKATRSIPIIVLTGFPGEADFFHSSLDKLGVVEFMRKPVDVGEVARVVKRVLGADGGRVAPPVFESGRIRVAPETRCVWIGGELAANIPPKRFEILFYLLQAKRGMSWRELRDRVWGAGGGKNDVQKAVQRLRRDLGREGWRVRTIAGGYRLETV